MATPHIAGVVAAILSQWWDYNQSQIKALLSQHTTDVTYEPGKNIAWLIDLESLMTSLWVDKDIITCTDQQHIEQEECINNQRVCDVDNGQWTQQWIDDQRSACEEVVCNDWFRLHQNACTAIDDIGQELTLNGDTLTMQVGDYIPLHIQWGKPPYTITKSKEYLAIVYHGQTDDAIQIASDQLPIEQHYLIDSDNTEPTQEEAIDIPTIQDDQELLEFLWPEWVDDSYDEEETIQIASDETKQWLHLYGLTPGETTITVTDSLGQKQTIDASIQSKKIRLRRYTSYLIPKWERYDVRRASSPSRYVKFYKNSHGISVNPRTRGQDTNAGRNLQQIWK